jgi:hypothetical protein
VLFGVTLAGQACSGKSIRHRDGSGEDGFADDGSGDDGVPAGGTAPLGGTASGGTAGSATGGLVSRGGAVSRGGQAGAGGASGAGGGTAGVGGAAGAMDCVDDECWDGRTCRTELATSGCPGTYREALQGEPVDGVDCAGPTTEGFVYVYQDFAVRICAYDTKGQLFASEFSDDNDSHCDSRTDVVVAGGPLPRQFTLTEFDRYRGCSLSAREFAAASPSLVFTELYPLVTSGRPCVASADQCRSSILLLVCRGESGESSCDVCETDADCRSEYSYLEPDALYCDEGACRFDERPLGSCDEGRAAPQCRTSASTYVCDLGACSVCLADDECVLATNGERGSCADDGSCVAD